MFPRLERGGEGGGARTSIFVSEEVKVKVTSGNRRDGFDQVPRENFLLLINVKVG